MYRVKLLFIALVLFLVAGMVQAQEFVVDGLIAMWTMDDADIDGDTVKDASGNGNDATIMGTVQFTNGVIGKALLLDGTVNNYIEIPDMGEMETDSVECWAYEEAFAGIQGIISTWQWEAGKVHFKFESNQIQVDKNGVGKITSPGVNQQWYHIIYTQGIDDGIKLYVDGELASELPSAGALPENWHERRIGSEHDGRFLNGMIDEVRVYNRILTPEEVTKNFEVTSNKMAVEHVGKLTSTWGNIKQF
ncbi:hypothetical protein GF312_03795 [Candidatus Poribacteria bacterium]|nr:hypothetical protein [Candidatus Poribacteria bacterium]